MSNSKGVIFRPNYSSKELFWSKITPLELPQLPIFNSVVVIINSVTASRVC